MHPSITATSETNDPVIRLRVRSTLVLLPFVGVVLGILWFLNLSSNEMTLTDLYGLPIMVVLIAAMTALLAFQPHRFELVQRVAIAASAIFLLVDFGNNFLSETMRTGQPGQSAPWFPVMMIMAFFSLSFREAMLFGGSYWLISLVIGVIEFRGSINARQLNTLLNFYAGNAVILGLLWGLGRLRVEYALVQRSANTDVLTGLTNRRSMQAHLRQLMQSGVPFSIFMIDVDHFKDINDQHGHALGDQVLRELGFALVNHVRSRDVVARWGGEEFIVAAPGINPERLLEVGERLLEVVRASRPGSLKVTVSVGGACRRDHESLETMLHRADVALYRAKANGRDRMGLESDPAKDSLVELMTEAR